MSVDVGWATIVLATVTAVLAGITAYHAWQSRRLVSEMRKDRRRQFLESALQKAYSPLFEILRRGFQESLRSRSGTFVFGVPDTDKIREIVDTHGHYLDSRLLEEIRKTIIDNPRREIQDEEVMGPLYKEAMNKCQTLSKELQNLVISS